MAKVENQRSSTCHHPRSQRSRVAEKHQHEAGKGLRPLEKDAAHVYNAPPALKPMKRVLTLHIIERGIFVLYFKEFLHLYPSHSLDVF